MIRRIHLQKKLLFMSLLLLCSCNSSNRITGAAVARVMRIDCELSAKETDTEFLVQDMIEPISANQYLLNMKIHYTVRLHFEIGGGSIPPSIPADDLHMDYDKTALNMERIKTDYNDDAYLNYITFYDLFIWNRTENSSVVFSINDVSSSIVLSTY